MGDPRKFRKKYDTPRHPWQKTRIEEEIVLKKEYGLKNKVQIWKMESKLKSFKDQAKNLITQASEQADKERKQLFAKLEKIGLLQANAKLDDILGLSIQDIMKRRLQTLVVKNGLARTMKQARQLIVHQHIKVGTKQITMPSYLVPVADEVKINYVERSSFSKPDHPERPGAEELAKKMISRPGPEEKEEVKVEVPAKEEVKVESSAEVVLEKKAGEAEQ